MVTPLSEASVGGHEASVDGQALSSTGARASADVNTDAKAETDANANADVVASAGERS
ncbi:hypothetical protein [Natronosalvus vescus]|uniref:hypothetical protein n=1 Tax=Natronosalvus vescus TaxID=2953881 RepID=UPI002091C5E5|nr:hypothetical protein [Natronosalvus vescus]